MPIVPPYAGATATQKAKYPVNTFPRQAIDDSGTVSAAIDNVTFTGGEWDDFLPAFEYNADGTISKTVASGSSHRRAVGYVAKFNTVRVRATIEKRGATNDYVMALAGGTSGDPTGYYIGGHGAGGSGTGYKIWKCVAGSFTVLAEVAETWSTGSRVVEFRVSHVPGGMTGGNTAKTALGLYVDGELVLNHDIESSLPTLGKRCGLWVDNLSAAAGERALISDFEVLEPTYCQIVALMDSYGAASVSGASTDANRAIILAQSRLGYDLDNISEGAMTIAEGHYDNLEDWIATGDAADNNILFVQLGVNDIDRGATVPQMLNDLKSLAARARETGLFRGLAVGTLPPVRDITDEQGSIARAYNEQLALRYKELGFDAVSMAGFDERFNGTGAYNGQPSFAANLASSSSTDDGLFTDELHPNNYGHRVLAHYITSAIYAAGGE
jgi:lysophospholipase L1-like esterase